MENIFQGTENLMLSAFLVFASKAQSHAQSLSQLGIIGFMYDLIFGPKVGLTQMDIINRKLLKNSTQGTEKFLYQGWKNFHHFFFCWKASSL